MEFKLSSKILLVVSAVDAALILTCASMCFFVNLTWTEVGDMLQGAKGSSKVVSLGFFGG